MKALLLTKEFPPHVYGGAGVHVEYLSRELAKLIDVEVRCFGDQDVRAGRLRVEGYPGDAQWLEGTDAPLRSPLDAFQRCLSVNARPLDASVVHCHTWYTSLGGIVAKLAYGLPLVVTAHSLEPLRAWKREQLGRGYDVSTWIERCALEMADGVVAVSQGMKDDILRLFAVPAERVHVVYNGLDTDEYQPAHARGALATHGIDAQRPYVLFVGRITRQKGLRYLIEAIPHLPGDVQVVLCAGAPDTEAIGREIAGAVAAVQRRRPHVIWIQKMVDKPTVIELYSHAAVFCCPSIYEPFGIINLEAMACGTPVVATAVGGVPEVVVDGETGLLVDVDPRSDGSFAPRDPDRLARDLAAAITCLIADAPLRARMGAAGRRRVIERFSWSAIARETVRVYEAVRRPNQ
jgi:glycogen synthase